MKGSEINIGDNIIIPKDIKIDAITISITRNGRKIRKPISNAVFNSDVINAGKTIEIGIACLSSNGPTSERSANIFNVSTLVFETINSLRTDKPWLIAISVDKFPSTKWVKNTNKIFLSVKVDIRNGRIIILSVIDNLLKGQTGQAIQNLNLINGLSMDDGLEFTTHYP